MWNRKTHEQPFNISNLEQRVGECADENSALMQLMESSVDLIADKLANRELPGFDGAYEFGLTLNCLIRKIEEAYGIDPGNSFRFSVVDHYLHAIQDTTMRPNTEWINIDWAMMFAATAVAVDLAPDLTLALVKTRATFGTAIYGTPQMVIDQSIKTERRPGGVKDSVHRYLNLGRDAVKVALKR